MSNIIIADDHPLTLQGTKNFILSLGYTVVDTCDDGIKAFNLIRQNEPEIAILDINMKGYSGLDVLKLVHEKKIPVKIILLTMHKELSIYKFAKAHDVFGFVLKEYAFDELEKCLSEVQQGRKYFSPSLLHDLLHDSSNAQEEVQRLSFAERKIIDLIGQGKTSKQIAEMLYISEKTVEGHRRNIIEKLHLPKEKNALSLWAARNLNTK